MEAMSLGVVEVLGGVVLEMSVRQLWAMSTSNW